MSCVGGSFFVNDLGRSPAHFELLRGRCKRERRSLDSKETVSGHHQNGPSRDVNVIYSDNYVSSLKIMAHEGSSPCRFNKLDQIKWLECKASDKTRANFLEQRSNLQLHDPIWYKQSLCTCVRQHRKPFVEIQWHAKKNQIQHLFFSFNLRESLMSEIMIICRRELESNPSSSTPPFARHTNHYLSFICRHWAVIEGNPFVRFRDTWKLVFFSLANQRHLAETQGSFQVMTLMADNTLISGFQSKRSVWQD